MEFLTFLASLVLAIGPPGPGQAETNTITTAAEIWRVPNPQYLEGRRVELSNLEIERALNTRFFLVWADVRKLAVRRQQEQPPLHPGEHIDVAGIINQLPAFTDRRTLPGRDNPILHDQYIYVNAIHLKLHKASAGGRGKPGG